MISDQCSDFHAYDPRKSCVHTFREDSKGNFLVSRFLVTRNLLVLAVNSSTTECL